MRAVHKETGSNSKMNNQLTTNTYFNKLKALNKRGKELDGIEMRARALGANQHQTAMEILNEVKGLKRRLSNDYADLDRERERAGIEEFC